MSVIDRLKNYVLVDGFHVVVDTNKSHGCWIVDVNGKKYLDCYSQFASQPLGWNHPKLAQHVYRLGQVALHKLANSDMYSEVYANFAETFSSITPDFKHFFFIDGGALAVENALKAAFDWVVRTAEGPVLDDEHNIIHFREAFHGRSGYTLSLTNTDPVKTDFFPKFNWTRLTNPKIHFPMDEHKVANLEKLVEQELNSIPKGTLHDTAAVIVETIQGEGGDNHFRAEFFQMLRRFTYQNNMLLIFDEVQCGMGLTGKMWAYEHYGVKPDILVFGKKSQVCGFCATDRIEQAQYHVFNESGRINSTWGGNIVDMARSAMIIDIIKSDNLVENARVVGEAIVHGLSQISGIDNVRGKGLMVAFDLPDKARRDEIYKKLQENMLILKSGERSIRLRPHLDFPMSEVSTLIGFVKQALS